MEINLPQYMDASERLEYIKIIHKVTSKLKKNDGVWTEGYLEALHHVEMVLSGAIKKIIWNEQNNK